MKTDGRLRSRELRKWIPRSPWFLSWRSRGVLVASSGRDGDRAPLTGAPPSAPRGPASLPPGSPEERVRPQAGFRADVQHSHVWWPHLAFEPGAPPLQEVLPSPPLQLYVELTCRIWSHTWLFPCSPHRGGDVCRLVLEEGGIYAMETTALPMCQQSSRLVLRPLKWTL